MYDLEIRFAGIVGPLLDRSDYAAVLAAIKEHYSTEFLIRLLGSDSPPIVRLATRCLGLVGRQRHAVEVAPLLRHADDAVAATAEDALWNIWMRGGSKAGNAKLASAVRLLNADKLEAALDLLDQVIDSDPEFAEAQHQRAIALHGEERLLEAEEAYMAAIECNPFHFAAIAGIGHIRAERGDFDGALRCYRESLGIKPRQPELAEVLPQLEAATRTRVVA